jgi:hypothetical protein
MNLDGGRQYEAGELVERIVVQQHVAWLSTLCTVQLWRAFRDVVWSSTQTLQAANTWTLQVLPGWSRNSFFNKVAFSVRSPFRRCSAVHPFPP